jgi:hypothetical protein
MNAVPPTSKTLSYLVLRRTGVSSRDLDRLLFNRTTAVIDRALALERCCRSDAAALCGILERRIGEGPPVVARALLCLRRDIYNDRLPKAKSVQAARAVFDVTSPIVRWIEARQERAELLQRGATVFQQELQLARVALKRLLSNREFRKGLALASSVLSDERRAYVAGSPSASEQVARATRVERSLVRYYSRSALKLSPFSSFTRTRLVRLVLPSVEHRRTSTSARTRIGRCVRINRTIVGGLARAIAVHPALRDYVPVWMGASALDERQGHVCVRRRYRAAGLRLMNVPEEDLIVVRSTPAIRWIQQYLGARGGFVPFHEIARALRDEVDDDGAHEYLSRLIERGVLVHALPLPVERTGLEALTHALAKMPVPVARELADLLGACARKAGQLAPADEEERKAILHDLHGLVREAFASVDATLTYDAFPALLFEDCVEEPVAETCPRPEWTGPQQDLATLLTLCGDLLDVNLSFRVAVRYLLRECFQGGPVPLLELMARVHRLEAPAPRESRSSGWSHTPNPYGLEDIARLGRLRDAIGRALSEPSDVEERDLGEMARTDRWLERFHEIGLDFSRASRLCVSCFGQPLVTDDGALRFVLNGLDAGPARGALRACANLSDGAGREQVANELATELREWFAPTEPCQLVANHDFNPNLHPRVITRVVDYSDAAAPDDATLSLADLSLWVDDRGHVQILDRRSAREIALIATGTFADRLGPPIQRLLFALSHVRIISTRPFQPHAWTSAAGAADVERYPRLVLGRCVVRRRTWSFARAVLPMREVNESDFAFFLRIRRWAQQHGLPDAVFVRARRSAESGGDGSGRSQWTRHKPEYVSFSSYLHVDVFAKILRGVTDRLYIEEMLPGRAANGTPQQSRPIEIVFDVCVPRASRDSQPEEYSHAAEQQRASALS